MESIKFDLISVLAVMTLSLCVIHALPMDVLEDVASLPYCTKPTNLSVADDIPSKTYAELNKAMKTLNDSCVSEHKLVSVTK